MAVLSVSAAAPFPWFAVARYHSIVHYWFTYRSFALSFGIVLASLLVVARLAPVPTTARDQESL